MRRACVVATRERVTGGTKFFLRTLSAHCTPAPRPTAVRIALPGTLHGVLDKVLIFFCSFYVHRPRIDEREPILTGDRFLKTLFFILFLFFYSAIK